MARPANEESVVYIQCQYIHYFALLWLYIYDAHGCTRLLPRHLWSLYNGAAPRKNRQNPKAHTVISFSQHARTLVVVETVRLSAGSELQVCRLIYRRGGSDTHRRPPPPAPHLPRPRIRVPLHVLHVARTTTAGAPLRPRSSPSFALSSHSHLSGATPAALLTSPQPTDDPLFASLPPATPVPTRIAPLPVQHPDRAPPGIRASKWPHDHSGHPRLHPRKLHLRRLFSARPTLNTFLPSPHSLLPRFPPHTTEHNHRLGAASNAPLDSTLPAHGYALPSFVAPRPCSTSPTRSSFPTPRSALSSTSSARSYSSPAGLPPRESRPAHTPPTPHPRGGFPVPIVIGDAYSPLGGADPSLLLVAAHGARCPRGPPVSARSPLARPSTRLSPLVHAITLNSPQSTSSILPPPPTPLPPPPPPSPCPDRPSHATPTDTSLSLALRIQLPGARPTLRPGSTDDAMPPSLPHTST
ncbi:hypothetical protein DFH08DRAFT_979208 [Mycena albidolilacea]|uniref:Uncharacterized protein n=1 Tax=Mycena albidolilacea TaxID=1033008 RepID=A0AAD6YX14_9AGAR|nr:hypothetical protein DFH08DRAFT_979208 [Mycena albidolilacea]